VLDRGAMRWVAVAVVVSGCSLNFGSHDTSDVDANPDDCTIAEATCTDGVVSLHEYPSESCAMWNPPVAVYTCPGECTTDDMGLCFDANCAGPPELCVDPPAEQLPQRLACPDGARCSGDATTACGGVDECGADTVVGSCTCTGGVETCTEACADGLCGAGAVQAALVGTWSGTAAAYDTTYPLRLTIRADGHYYSERPGQESAFYYGTDGGGDARRFFVLGQTELGATAIVRIFFGFDSVTDGVVRRLRIAGDHLTFDVYIAWYDCSRYAQFDLVREL